jgi:hypothetical protein
MAHRDAVRDLVRAEWISFVCLQETKLDVISAFDVMQIVGAGFDYFFLPAVHTRGGILVAWQPTVWMVSCTLARQFSVLAKVRHASSDVDWWLSLVYGPFLDADRPAFFEELHALRQVRLGPWLIYGDLKMIYRSQDKNNGRLHRRRIGQFRWFINELSL